MYELIGISMMLAGAMLAALGVSVALTLAWPALERTAQRCSPMAESRMWFGVGMAPVAAGLVMSVLLVAPGYLIYEPRHTGERIGVALALLAGIAAVVLIATGVRLAVLAHRSVQLADLLRNSGKPIELDGLSEKAYAIPVSSRLTTVVGLGRPTLFLSQAVLAALDRAELNCVVRHEQAHVASWDNLSALLLELAGWLSGNPLFARAVKARWLEAVEIGADDRAAQDSDDALNLMSALVKVARLREANTPVAAVGCSFLPKATKSQMKRRVEHLKAIANGERRTTAIHSGAVLAAAGVVLLAISALVAMVPMPMAWAHAALEILVKL